jgi:hypothetical protein
MAKTPEQILRDIITEQIFTIAKLASDNEKLTEQVKEYESEDLITFLSRKKVDGRK